MGRGRARTRLIQRCTGSSAPHDGDLGPEDFTSNRTETFQLGIGGGAGGGPGGGGAGAPTHSFTLTGPQRAELVAKGKLTVVTGPAGSNAAHAHADTRLQVKFTSV